jgi:hypothetical protein
MKKSRKVRFAGLLAACLCALAFAPPIPDSTGDLEDLVRRWLEVRRERHRSEAEWEEQKVLLDEELAMLERRRERQLATLEVQEREEERLREEVAAIEADRRRHEEILALVDSPLRAAEETLRSWPSLLPPAYFQPLAKTFARLAAGGDAMTLATVADRVQTVLLLYSQLEQFNASVRAEKMILEDPGGREREMDVLFFGFAGAIAVSGDDRLAARGRITRSGWTWDWDPSLASAFRSAWARYRKEEPASFVTIPLRIGEGRR